jgi:hypothetical protein
VKVEQLENEIRKLPSDLRANLYTRLGLSETYKAKRNVPLHFEDWITLNDSSAQYKEKPQIKVTYRDSSDIDAGEDVIDIVDSVKKDLRCMGHPLILFAILRWSVIVEWKHSLAKKDVKSAEEYQTAKAHLQRIGAALFEGAKERAVPKEFASIYGQFPERGGRYGTLAYAWRVLADDSVKKIRNINLKLEEIQKRLQAEHSEENVRDIMAFFKSDEGRRFITQRRSWQATIRGYDAWAVSLTPETYKRYHFEAEKQARKILAPLNRENSYTIVGDEFTLSNIARALGDWFSLPYSVTQVDEEG